MELCVFKVAFTAVLIFQIAGVHLRNVGEDRKLEENNVPHNSRAPPCESLGGRKR